MFSSLKSKLYSAGAVVGSMAMALYGGVAHAAVDADVASTTAGLTATIRDNIVGAVTANISTMVVAGVLILSILVIWRLAKRFVSGR